MASAMLVIRDLTGPTLDAGDHKERGQATAPRRIRFITIELTTA